MLFTSIDVGCLWWCCGKSFLIKMQFFWCGKNDVLIFTTLSRDFPLFFTSVSDACKIILCGADQKTFILITFIEIEKKKGKDCKHNEDVAGKVQFSFWSSCNPIKFSSLTFRQMMLMKSWVFHFHFPTAIALTIFDPFVILSLTFLLIFPTMLLFWVFTENNFCFALKWHFPIACRAMNSFIFYLRCCLYALILFVLILNIFRYTIHHCFMTIKLKEREKCLYYYDDVLVVINLKIFHYNLKKNISIFPI